MSQKEGKALHTSTSVTIACLRSVIGHKNEAFDYHKPAPIDEALFRSAEAGVSHEEAAKRRKKVAPTENELKKVADKSEDEDSYEPNQDPSSEVNLIHIGELESTREDKKNF